MKYQNQKEIPLIQRDEESYINLSEESITDFILICQHQKIKINNQNVVPINYLSNKYEVVEMIELTENFILQHNDELIFEMFSINTNQRNSEWETKIAQNLPYFLHNKNLHELSIPAIHSILSQSKNINENEKIEFLFKCLDKHGRKASSLFSEVNFDDDKIKYIDILINDYYDIFDFNFIGEKYKKILYQKNNEIIKNFIKLNDTVKKLEETTEKQKLENELLKQKYDEQQQQIKIEREIIKKQEQKLQEIQKELEETKMQLQDLQSIQNQNVQQLQEITKKQKSQIQNLDDQIKATNNLNKRFQDMTKEINVAYIITQNEGKKVINLDFINDLNRRDIRINIRTINEKDLINIIKSCNPDFLLYYNVLIFGGSDGYNLMSSSISFLNNSNYLKKYTENGGAILLLHDVNTGKYPEKFNDPKTLFQPFSKNLGFIKNKTRENDFTKCQFVNKKCQLSEYPYIIKDPFDVSVTHETSVYNEKFMLIKSADGKNSHYYSENPEHKIGDCTMGHSTIVSNEEKKLLYNILYHLSQM